MLVYQRVTLCANFFLGVEDWILLGFFHCFLYQKFHPIPNSPLKDMAIDCFLRPIRYSDTPISSQLWEQTSRCSWHADGWRPIPGWCYQGSASRGTACCFWFLRLGWWESLEKSGSRSWGWKTSQIPMDPMVSGSCFTKTPKLMDFSRRRRKSIHPWPGSFGSDEAPIYSKSLNHVETNTGSIWNSASKFLTAQCCSKFVCEKIHAAVRTGVASWP